MRGFPPTIPMTFIGLMLVGTLGISYIVDVIYGRVEFQAVLFALSLSTVGVSLLLSLRILYHVDKRSSRIKKSIRWLEPLKEEGE